MPQVTRSKVAGFPSSVVGLKSFTSRSWEAYLALKNKGFVETETKGKKLKWKYNFKEKGSLPKCRTPVLTMIHK
jgi:hypothetical protein